MIDFRIPEGAIKLGPFGEPFGETSYRYLLPSAPENSDKWLVAIEMYKGAALLRRYLYRDGKLHGVRRVWYANGVLCSEEPFRNGVMDGEFRHWDSTGKCIGDYEIVAGTGVAKVFDSRGTLVRETHYLRNVQSGLEYTFSPESGLHGISYFKGGNRFGWSQTYSAKLELIDISYCTIEGWLSGPYIKYYPDPKADSVKWFLAGRVVTAEEYEKASKTNPKLPPYLKTAEEYKELLPSEDQKLIKKFAESEKVTIPLTGPT